MHVPLTDQLYCSKFSFLTVNSAEALMLASALLATVIVVLPSAIGLTEPLLTVATFSSEDDHTTSLPEDVSGVYVTEAVTA